MTTFSKQILSGSTNGRAVRVVQITSPGTGIHVGPSVTTEYDEVWLYAQNTDTSPRKLTIEWGGVTSPDDLIEITIPAESGLTLVVPGLVLKGNATQLVVKAFAATTNVVTIHGYVNRIS